MTEAFKTLLAAVGAIAVLAFIVIGLSVAVAMKRRRDELRYREYWKE